MKDKKASFKKQAKLLGTEREGLLISTFGANAEVEDEQGNLIRCHIRKNSDPVITGDRVLWLPEKDGTGVIVGHADRASLLCRPENSNKVKPVAANINAIIIVTAPPPVLDENMIDRYLVAAETLNIQPVILLNKIDLLDEQGMLDVKKRLSVYEKIGYPVIYSSTLTEQDLLRLDTFLNDKTCVLVGTSGVGKSSIIAAFTHESSIRIGEVSASSGLGKHTTTTTRLYHLPHGGNLIDSPGVREFGLWNVSAKELLAGFVEFRDFMNDCKFRDCKHLKEPQCAVQKAVAEGKIDLRRYENFKAILADLTGK